MRMHNQADIGTQLKHRIKYENYLNDNILIAFKGAIFYNLLTAPRTVSSTCAQVARAQSCANHVQDIERLSRATCRVTCQAVQRDSSAIKFDRAEITFILVLVIG